MLEDVSAEDALALRRRAMGLCPARWRANLTDLSRNVGPNTARGI